MPESVCGNVCELWAPRRFGDAPRPGSRDALQPGHSTNMGFADVGSALCSPCLVSKRARG